MKIVVQLDVTTKIIGLIDLMHHILLGNPIEETPKETKQVGDGRGGNQTQIYSTC